MIWLYYLKYKNGVDVHPTIGLPMYIRDISLLPYTADIVG